MPNIGPLEIAVLVIVVLLIFGPKRLPELGKSVGKSIREFKGSIGGEDEKKHDERAQIAAADPTPAPPAVKTEEEKRPPPS